MKQKYEIWLKVLTDDPAASDRGWSGPLDPFDLSTGAAPVTTARLRRGDGRS
jgi:hypothetical protein